MTLKDIFNRFCVLFDETLGYCMKDEQMNEVGECCGDNRFEVIEKARKLLIECTNIQSRKDEMKVLDSILLRCWQMGWLDSI